MVTEKRERALMSARGGVYLGAAASYGVARKILATNDATVRSPDGNRHPMLVSQRAIVTLVGGAFSAMTAPLCVARDLMRLEVTLRGMRPESYGMREPETMIEHVVF